MKINGTKVEGFLFAYDGCHKMYLLESEEEMSEALKAGYHIIDTDYLKETYFKSCPLRFINNWSLTKVYASQGKKAKFE